MLPTTQTPVLRADADVERNEGLSSLFRLLLADLVELVDPLQHVDGGVAGVKLMRLVVERRVPERHDGVAHIFVDGALARQDRVRERRQEAVHEPRQSLRIVLEALRDRGEGRAHRKTGWSFRALRRRA